jgi:hypothetical protein
VARQGILILHFVIGNRDKKQQQQNQNCKWIQFFLNQSLKHHHDLLLLWSSLFSKKGHKGKETRKCLILNDAKYLNNKCIFVGLLITFCVKIMEIKCELHKN